MDDDKKIAAAITAVNRYMQNETSEPGHPGLSPEDLNGGLTSRMNLWGASGRLYRMQMRSLMQLRTFNKLR